MHIDLVSAWLELYEITRRSISLHPNSAEANECLSNNLVDGVHETPKDRGTARPDLDEVRF